MDDAHRKRGYMLKAVTLLILLGMGAGVYYFIRRQGGEGLFPAPNAPADGTALFGAAAAPGPAEPGPGPEEREKPAAGLAIEGPEDFKGRVTGALKLIWLSDKEAFYFVRRNVSVIRAGGKTERYASEGLSIVEVSGANSGRSLTWLAGIIAHHAWHSGEKGRPRRAGLVPPPPGQKLNASVAANPASFKYAGLDDILAEEKRASDFQLKVLAAVGAPARELREVRDRDPRSMDVAHDGAYSTKP